MPPTGALKSTSHDNITALRIKHRTHLKHRSFHGRKDTTMIPQYMARRNSRKRRMLSQELSQELTPFINQPTANCPLPGPLRHTLVRRWEERAKSITRPPIRELPIPMLQVLPQKQAVNRFITKALLVVSQYITIIPTVSRER